MYGLPVGFLFCTADCRLEDSVHEEGPATGQLDHAVKLFYSVLHKMVCSYTHYRCQLMLFMLPSQILNANYLPNTDVMTLSKFRLNAVL